MPPDYDPWNTPILTGNQWQSFLTAMGGPWQNPVQTPMIPRPEFGGFAPSMTPGATPQMGFPQLPSLPSPQMGQLPDSQSGFWQNFGRGLNLGTTAQIPELAGNFLDFIGPLVGAAISGGTMRSSGPFPFENPIGEKIRSVGQALSEYGENRAKELVQQWGEKPPELGQNPLGWAGMAMGSGLPTVATSAIPGLGAAKIVGKAAGPIKAAKAATKAVLGSSMAMGAGDIYGTLGEAGMEAGPFRSALTALGAIPYGLAEGIVPTAAVSKLLSSPVGGTLKQRAKQVGKEALVGAGQEALTEGAQSGITQVAAAIGAGEEIDWGELGESMLAGALVGGPVAGGAALHRELRGPLFDLGSERRPRTEQEPPQEDEVQEDQPTTDVALRGEDERQDPNWRFYEGETETDKGPPVWNRQSIIQQLFRITQDADARAHPGQKVGQEGRLIGEGEQWTEEGWRDWRMSLARHMMNAATTARDAPEGESVQRTIERLEQALNDQGLVGQDEKLRNDLATLRAQLKGNYRLSDQPRGGEATAEPVEEEQVRGEIGRPVYPMGPGPTPGVGTGAREGLGRGRDLRLTGDVATGDRGDGWTRVPEDQRAPSGDVAAREGLESGVAGTGQQLTAGPLRGDGWVRVEDDTTPNPFTGETTTTEETSNVFTGETAPTQEEAAPTQEAAAPETASRLPFRVTDGSGERDLGLEEAGTHSKQVGSIRVYSDDGSIYAEVKTKETAHGLQVTTTYHEASGKKLPFGGKQENVVAPGQTWAQTVHGDINHTANKYAAAIRGDNNVRTPSERRQALGTETEGEETGTEAAPRPNGITDAEGNALSENEWRGVLTAWDKRKGFTHKGVRIYSADGSVYLDGKWDDLKGSSPKDSSKEYQVIRGVLRNADGSIVENTRELKVPLWTRDGTISTNEIRQEIEEEREQAKTVARARADSSEELTYQAARLRGAYFKSAEQRRKLKNDLLESKAEITNSRGKAFRDKSEATRAAMRSEGVRVYSIDRGAYALIKVGRRLSYDGGTFEFGVRGTIHDAKTNKVIGSIDFRSNAAFQATQAGPTESAENRSGRWETNRAADFMHAVKDGVLPKVNQAAVGLRKAAAQDGSTTTQEATEDTRTEEGRMSSSEEEEAQFLARDAKENRNARDAAVRRHASLLKRHVESYGGAGIFAKLRRHLEILGDIDRAPATRTQAISEIRKILADTKDTNLERDPYLDKLFADLEAAIEATRQDWADRTATSTQPVSDKPKAVGTRGRKQQTRFGNRKVQTQYVAMEMDDVVASHTPKFGKRPESEYPSEIQGRAYHGPQGELAREHTLGIAISFDTDRALDMTSGVLEGAPVVTPSGIVVAGNGRTIAHQNLLAGGRQNLKDELADRAEEFGLDANAIRDMKAPMLVRVIIDPKVDVTDPNVLRELNTESDVSVAKSKDAVSHGATRARAFARDNEAVDYLFREMPSDMTFTAWLDTASGRGFLQKLVDRNIIRPQELNEFADGTGKITDAGKRQITEMLESAAITDPDILNTLSSGLRRKLRLTFPALVKASAHPAWDLRAVITDAARFVTQFRGDVAENPSMTYARGELRQAMQQNPGKSELELRMREYVRRSQGGGLLGDQAIPDHVVDFAVWLATTPAAEARQAMQTYAAEAAREASAEVAPSLGIVEELTPVEARKQIFGIDYDPDTSGRMESAAEERAPNIFDQAEEEGGTEETPDPFALGQGLEDAVESLGNMGEEKLADRLYRLHERVMDGKLSEADANRQAHGIVMEYSDDLLRDIERSENESALDPENMDRVGELRQLAARLLGDDDISFMKPPEQPPPTGARGTHPFDQGRATEDSRSADDLDQRIQNLQDRWRRASEREAEENPPNPERLNAQQRNARLWAGLRALVSVNPTLNDNEPLLSLEKIRHSPLFKAWFLTSQAKNDDGDPLGLWHASISWNPDKDPFPDIGDKLGIHMGTQKAAHHAHLAKQLEEELKSLTAVPYETDAGTLWAWRSKNRRQPIKNGRPMSDGTYLPAPTEADALANGEHVLRTMYLNRKFEGFGYPKNLVKVYLRILNPFDLGNDPGEWTPDAIVKAVNDSVSQGGTVKLNKAQKEIWGDFYYLVTGKGGVVGTDWGWKGASERKKNKALRDVLEEMGFDGMRYTNLYEDVGSTSWVAFRASQIKSAKDNHTFDINSDNIFKIEVEPPTGSEAHKRWYRNGSLNDEEGKPRDFWHAGRMNPRKNAIPHTGGFGFHAGSENASLDRIITTNPRMVRELRSVTALWIPTLTDEKGIPAAKWPLEQVQKYYEKTGLNWSDQLGAGYFVWRSEYSAGDGKKYKTGAEAEEAGKKALIEQFREELKKKMPEGVYKIRVHVRMEKPYRVKDLGEWHPYDFLYETDFMEDDTVTITEERRELLEKYMEWYEGDQDIRKEPADEDEIIFIIVQSLKDAGYDGFVYRNDNEDPGSESVAVWDPNQIKAVRNQGTYSLNDDNIFMMSVHEPLTWAERQTVITRTIESDAFLKFYRNSSLRDPVTGKPRTAWHGGPWRPIAGGQGVHGPPNIRQNAWGIGMHYGEDLTAADRIRAGGWERHELDRMMAVEVTGSDGVTGWTWKTGWRTSAESAPIPMSGSPARGEVAEIAVSNPQYVWPNRAQALRAAGIYIRSAWEPRNFPDVVAWSNAWPDAVKEHIAMTEVFLRIENPYKMRDHGTWSPIEVMKEVMRSNGMVLVGEGSPSPNVLRRATIRPPRQPVQMTATDLQHLYSILGMEQDNTARAEENRDQLIAGLLRDVLERNGYDGVWYRNRVEAPGSDSWIVFRPEQVKAAIGNTRFSPEEPDIFYMQAPGGGANPELAGWRGREWAEEVGQVRQRPPRQTPVIKVESIPEITEKMRKVLAQHMGQGLKVAGRRASHFREVKTALGFYDVRTGLVQLRNTGDVHVVAHELGHVMVRALFGRAGYRSWIEAVPQAVYDDIAYYAKYHAHDRSMDEGIAEFFQIYLLRPDFAQEHTPIAFRYFDELLQETAPAIWNVYNDARAQIAKHFSAPASSRIRASIKDEDQDFGPAILASWPERFWSRWVDRHLAVGKATDIVRRRLQRQGKQLLDSQDLENILRQLAGSGGKASVWVGAPMRNKLGRKIDGTFWGGQLAYKSNKEVEYVGKSLIEILDPVGNDLAFFEEFLAARRSIELHQRNVQNFAALADAQRTVEEVREAGLYTLFSSVAEDVYSYQNNLIRYLTDVGLISEYAYDAIIANNEYYVPFRQANRREDRIGARGETHLRSPLKNIRGASGDIRSPLKQILTNTYNYMKLAEQKRAADAIFGWSEQDEMADLVDSLVQPYERTEFQLKDIVKQLTTAFPEMKSAYEQIKKGYREKVKLYKENDAPWWEIPKPWEQMLAIYSPGDYYGKENVISGKAANGQTVWKEVDPELYEQMAPVMDLAGDEADDIMSLAAKVLRFTATTNASFWTSNFSRDQLTAAVLSDGVYIPGVDFVSGLFSRITKDKNYTEWLQGGGSMASYMSQHRVSDLKRNIERLIKDGTSIKGVIKNGFDLLMAVSQASDEATRIGAYKRARAAGMSIQQAVRESREITTDFNRRGSSPRAQMIGKWTAFWNAGLQGQARTLRELVNDPKKGIAKLAVRGAMWVLPWTILEYLINHDDEEYWDMPQWRRDAFWHFGKIGGLWITVKKPFLIGQIFGTMPTHLFAMMDADPNTRGDLWAWLRGWGRSEALSLVPLPTLSVPLIEGVTNHSFFMGRPVVPRTKQDLSPRYQFNENTSEVAKVMGDWLNLSPFYIDNAIYGYTSSIGRGFTSAMDFAVDQVRSGPRRPARGLEKQPYFRSMLYRPGWDSEQTEKFYEARDRVYERAADLRQIMADGNVEAVRKWLSDPENAFLSAMKPVYDRHTGTVSDLRQMERLTYYNRTMTSREKRARIRELQQRYRQSMISFQPNLQPILDRGPQLER